MAKQIRSPSMLVFCAVLGIGLVACGGDSETTEQTEQTEQTPAEDFASAIEGMREAAEGMASGERADPVDFRELQELLPEEVAGLSRVSHEGQRMRLAGSTVSMAEARYEAEDGSGSIDIEVTDTGGLAGVAAMAMAAWLHMDMERETDSGYERTTTYEGYPAYEEFESWDGDVGSAELSFVVGERFIVQIEGRDVRMEDVKDAADDLRIDRLEGLSR